MQVDPRITFWIGLVTTVAQILSNGALFAGVVPDADAHIVAGVNNIIGTIGTAVLTFLTGVSSSTKGPLVK